MSKLLETKMDEWQGVIDALTLDINDPNPAVAARARHLRKLIGTTISDWKACDANHTQYLIKEYGREDF